MSRIRVYEWCQQFREGRHLVTNELHRRVHLTAVTQPSSFGTKEIKKLPNPMAAARK